MYLCLIMHLLACLHDPVYLINYQLSLSFPLSFSITTVLLLIMAKVNVYYMFSLT